jgi:hypothetical protein
MALSDIKYWERFATLLALFCQQTTRTVRTMFRYIDEIDINCIALGQYVFPGLVCLLR